MNKEKILYFKRVILKKISEDGINTQSICHRLYCQDVRLLLLLEYKQPNNLAFKDELIVIKEKNYTSLEKTNEEITLMCEGETPNSKFEIGKGIIKSINENKIIIKPTKILIGKQEYSDDILNLFTKFNSKIINDKNLENKCDINSLNIFKSKYEEYNNKYDKNENEIKNKYIMNTFIYYYKFLIQLLKDNNSPNSYSKLTAASSYTVAKDYFKKYNVSLNNVFINNCKYEFDILLLNKKINNFKNVYDFKNITSIVELKSNGLIAYGKEDMKKNDRWFKSYITFNLKSDKNDDDIYNRIRKLPYIYFCFIEKTLTYENCFIDSIDAGNNYKCIFLTLKNDRYKYIIPIEYYNNI